MESIVFPESCIQFIYIFHIFHKKKVNFRPIFFPGHRLKILDPLSFSAPIDFRDSGAQGAYR